MTTKTLGPSRATRLPRPLDDRHLARLASLGSDFFCILDPAGGFVEVHPRVESLLGRSLEELLDRSLSDFVPPDQRPRLAEALAGAAAGVRPLPISVRLIDAGGVERFLIWRFESGGPAGDVLAVGRDVTDIHLARALNRAEEDVLRARSVLRSICQVQRMAIMNREPGRVFDYLLNEFLSLTGSQYGFIGEVLHSEERDQPYLKTHAITNIAWDDETRAFFDANAPDGMEFYNLDTLFGAVLRTGEPVISDDPASDPRAGGLPPGHPEMTRFLGVPLSDGEGFVGMLGIANSEQRYDEALIEFLEPLTCTAARLVRAYRLRRERSAAELELRQSEDRRHLLELAHFDRVATIGEMAASLAHELNQPLCAIATNARVAQRLLRKEGPREVLSEALDDVAADAQRGGDIIRKLRTFLRKSDTHAESLCLNDVVSNAVKMIRTIDSINGACIRLVLDAEVRPVFGDRVQLEQVLTNLIRNGLESMEHLPLEERDLVVRTAGAPGAPGAPGTDGSDPAGDVHVSVIDNGRGVQPSQVAQLFNPFFTTKKDGMGMGLGICRTIVEAHGGELHYVDQESGAHFEFTLPMGGEHV